MTKFAFHPDFIEPSTSKLKMFAVWTEYKRLVIIFRFLFFYIYCILFFFFAGNSKPLCLTDDNEEEGKKQFTAGSSNMIYCVTIFILGMEQVLAGQQVFSKNLM